MNITAGDFEQFMDVIEALVRKGLMFKAHSGTLTITLTGGY